MDSFSAPALTAHATSATFLTQEGALRALSHAQARERALDVVVCHAPATAARLGLKAIPGALDALELYAFTRPAAACVPSPLGLARALGLSAPEGPEDGTITLMRAARALVTEAAQDQSAVSVAAAMGARWPWTRHILAAAGAAYDSALPPDPRAFAAWEGLPDWAMAPPRPEGAPRPLTEQEATEALARALPLGAEDREGQRDYAAFIARAFASPRSDGAPHLILAEGATGTGKTLAYLAPAAAWAERAGEPVWVSTYTKNLQRQIGHALEALWPDPAERARHAATRKGRENTLCLLSLEELAASPRHAVAAGIMARWAAATPDGDLSGAAFPGWLPALLGFAGTLGLSDRRGECIYTACPHYKKCFIERSARAAEGARIVVANHALTMAKAALAQPGESLPTRYIFDEGHHLFDAADSAFATRVTGREMADLRRWILGPEGGAVRSRRKGLARRAEGLVEGDEAAEEALRAVLRAARDLAGAGWSERLAAPRGPGEAFLAACAAQIAAAGPHHGAGFGKEALAHPAPPALAEAAVALAEAFSALEKPMVRLAARLLALGQAPDLDPDDRARTEALARALAFRAEHHLAPWRVALGALDGSGSEEAFCDILVAEPEPGADLGLARHWVDPMRPFARAIDPRADGIALTSATLRDGRGLGAWGMATLRSGAVHLAHGHARTAAFPSPFAYVDCARVFVVTDVDRADSGAVAGAMRALFEAAGGGALGLFTAISRLKATRARIAAPLEAAGLPLYAQHVDEMDVGTLLDLFRAEEDSCLLGTDAVRDGVDVPGRALRLLVMDRVPWPRPGLLHRARRAAFGARAWDDASTRLRLTQAFGRLVRREGDRGVFVLLDPRLPSRLADAFPEGVEVRRLGLQAVLREVGGFLQEEV